MAQRRERSTRRQTLSAATLLQARIQRLSDIRDRLDQCVFAWKRTTEHDNEPTQPDRAVIDTIADSMRAMAYVMKKPHDEISKKQTTTRSRDMSDVATVSENVVRDLKPLQHMMESESFCEYNYVASTLEDMADRLEEAL